MAWCLKQKCSLKKVATDACRLVMRPVDQAPGLSFVEVSAMQNDYPGPLFGDI